MENEENKSKPKIGMLLDIQNANGETQGRIVPILAVLGSGCVLPLIYVYNGMWEHIPVWVLIIAEIIVVLWVTALVPGRQRERVEKYKRQLYSDYSEPAKLMNIKTIHPDGCIEYLNSRICYLVCCFNGTIDDDVQSSVQLRKLINAMIGDYQYDTYIMNVDEAPTLREYYDKVANFEKNAAAENFIRIIDNSRKLVSMHSVVTVTVFAIRGTRSDWKDMAQMIDVAIDSRLARRYKTIYRVRDPEMIGEILNRNADTVVNINELMRKKYATQQYGTSKVLAYDLPDDKEIVQGVAQVKSVIPEQKAQSFHQTYKKEED